MPFVSDHYEITEPQRSRDVQLALVDGPCTRFGYRAHLCVVPNVSWGMLPWEADLLVLRRTGWLEEVEIKVSSSDWKADKDKEKFRTHHKRTLFDGFVIDEAKPWNKAWEKVNRFWYAAPLTLAKRFGEMGIPDWAGVIGINSLGCQVLREAKKREDTRKLTDKETIKLCRLGAMRQWDLLRQLNARQELGPDNTIPALLPVATDLAEGVPQ